MAKGNLCDLQKQLENTKEFLGKASKQLTGMGDTITKGITQPIINLGAMAGKTAQDFERMKEAALENGQTAAFFAGAAADALNCLASVGDKVGSIEEAIMPFLDLTAVVGGVAGVAESAVGWIGVINKQLSAASQGTAGFGASLTGVFGPGGTVLLVTAAIAGLIALFMHLWETNEGFRNAIISAWQAIVDFLQPVFESIKTIALTVWTELQQFWLENSAAVMNLFSSAWEFIKAALAAVWNNIYTAAMTVFGLLQKFWETFGGTIISIFDTAWNTVKNTFNCVVAVLSGIMKTLTGLLAGDWEQAWEGIKQVWDTVRNYITDTFGNLKEIWSNIWDTIRDKIVGVWDAIKTNIKNGINGVIGAINKFIRGINNIEIKVPKITIPFVGEVGGWSIRLPRIPEIPTLAKGGIVTAPTLALIGEGREAEIVAPLSKLGDITGDSRPIIIYLDGKKIYEGVDGRLGSRALGLGVV